MSLELLFISLDIEPFTLTTPSSSNNVLVITTRWSSVGRMRCVGLDTFVSWLTRELSAPPRCMAGIRAQVCVCAWIGRDRVDIGKDERACDVAVMSRRRALRCVGSCLVIGALLHGFQCFLVGLQLTHRAIQCHSAPLGEQTVCWSSCGCDRMRLTWTGITLRRVSMMGFKKFSVPRHCHYDMWWRCGVGRAHAGVFASASLSAVVGGM